MTKKVTHVTIPYKENEQWNLVNFEVIDNEYEYDEINIPENIIFWGKKSD